MSAREALRAHCEEISIEGSLASRADLARVGPYRGYAETMSRLDAIADRKDVTVHELGRTVRGAPIFAFEVGAGSDFSLCVGGIHAMEWIGVEVAIELLTRAQGDERVIFVPLLHVDGYRAVERDLEGGVKRFRRANENGVDLNRNFPTHYTTRHLPSKVFPKLGHAGTGARSEPEVDALCRFVDAELARGRRCRRAVSLHSFGEMLLLPWGGTMRAPDRSKELKDAAYAVRARQRKKSRVVRVAWWYPGFSNAYGMEIDHFHGAWGATAVLVECTPGGLSLFDPSSWLHPFRWFNPPEPQPWIEDLATALAPYLAGD